MKISFKFIIWAWVVLLLMIGVLFYTAHLRLKPESLITHLNHEFQRSYPGSELKIQHVDYRFNIDFILKFSSVTLARQGQLIGKVRELELKIPWWLIIFNKGHAQINLNQLVLFIDDRAAKTNKQEKSASGEAADVVFTLPEYLSQANYTLRAKDITFQKTDSDESYLRISKLLVREFQMHENSAFELNVPVEILHKGKKYTSDLWLFGDITPEKEIWNLNYRGEFKTKLLGDKPHFEDLVITGQASYRPSSLEIKADYDFSMERKNIGQGKLSIEKDQMVADFNFSDFPLHYLYFASDELTNPFLPELTGEAVAQISLRRHFHKKIKDKVNGKLSFPGNFHLKEKTDFAGQWQISLDNSKLETSFLTPKGEISFFRRSFLNYEQGEVTQFSQEIGFFGVAMPLAVKSIQDLYTFITLPADVPYSTLVTFKNCPYLDFELDGNFRYGVSPGQKFYQAELKAGEGQFVLNYQAKPQPHQLELSYSHFPWNEQLTFLAPFFNVKEGVWEGKVAAQWPEQWSEGNWKISLQGQGMIEPRGMFFDYSQQAWQAFEVVPNHADRSWQLTLAKNAIALNSHRLEGKDPLELSGTLNLTDENSSLLTLKHPKDKKKKSVKKNVRNIFSLKENL